MVTDMADTDIDDFQQLILMDLNFEAFRVLANEIGDDKVREIFKPHMLNSGAAVVINVQKHLGLTITDIETFCIVVAFAGRSVWRAPQGKWILTAKGIEWHNPGGCYVSSAPPSMRRMFCDDMMPGYLMAYPEFGIGQSCLEKGDGECGINFYNKEDPSIDWRSRGGKDIPITTLVFDKEKMKQYGILALGELWLFPTQALMEWKGQEAIPKLKEAIRPLGRKWGKELSRVTGQLGNDMGAVFSVIDTYNSIMGQEGRTIYSSSDRHETDITICPFSVAPNEMGAVCGDAIGAQCEALCNGMCEAVSPDFELRFTTKMCAGGQCCHRVIRKKISARAVKER
jgi:hypothetical protein